MSAIIGIDLGTTYSAAAYVDDQGQLQVIPNPDGKTTTPSVVLLQDGRIVVGQAALHQWITNEEHVVRWIKRAMGDFEYRFQGMTPVDISAEILKSLKADAEAHFGQPVEDAVITCPAYFAAVEIENTKEAGERAGFRVREIIKEPTAAAVFYGVENMRDGQTVLICDLGGGTFDATILTFAKGVFTPRASMGSRKLGGHDWTMALVGLVAERVEEKFGEDPRNDPAAGQVLYENCEQAKRDLARLASVTVPCPVQQRLEQVPVARSDFEARTESFILELTSWCEQVLAKAKLSWSDIHRILLVGGSSRLRRMGEALKQSSGITPVQVREPDLAVAFGAAILARGQVRPRRGGLVDVLTGGLIEVTADRVVTRNLGTRVVKQDGGKASIISACIIPHGTKQPVSLDRDDLEVMSDNQKFFEAPIVEFEDQESTDFEWRGCCYRFSCPPNVRAGDRIRLTLSYDISGILKVAACHLRTGTPLEGERLTTYQDPKPEKFRVKVKPRWVVFTVDVSFSMEGDKLSRAKQGVIENARRLLAACGSSCKIGVVSFGSDANLVCSPTSDLSEVERTVNALSCTGSTAMNRGIRRAIELAEQAPPRTDRDIVMLTDGMPDERPSTVAAAADARNRGITFSTLSLSVNPGDVDEEFLKSLTPLTLKIESVSEISEGFSTLLSLAEKSRQGGLMEP